MNKLIVTAIAGLSVLAAPLAASAQPGGYGHGSYSGQSNWGRDGGDRGRDGGALLAAGVFGLILGSAIDSAQREDVQPAAYGYGPSYYGPSYYGPSYYGQDCGWQTQAYRDAWGRLAYQQVEVCR